MPQDTELSAPAATHQLENVEFRAPRLSDMPFLPEEVTVERGPRSVLFSVDGWEEEGIALLHDEAALTAWLSETQDVFPDGLDETAVWLIGDGEDLRFSFRQLMGVKYRLLGGRGYWYLQDGSDVILEFHQVQRWAPPETVPDSPAVSAS